MKASSNIPRYDMHRGFNRPEAERSPYKSYRWQKLDSFNGHVFLHLHYRFHIVPHPPACRICKLFHTLYFIETCNIWGTRFVSLTNNDISLQINWWGKMYVWVATNTTAWVIIFGTTFVSLTYVKTWTEGYNAGQLYNSWNITDHVMKRLFNKYLIGSGIIRFPW